MVINTIRTIILTIAITITTMVISYGKKNIIFVAKKVVVLTSIKRMSSRKQQKFCYKTKNSIKIKANLTHFQLIMKEIWRMILIMLIERPIIPEKNDKYSIKYIIAAYLSNKSFVHLLMAPNIFSINKASKTYQFIPDWYAEMIFQGIMPNTSIAKVSTVEKSQFKALQYEMPSIKIDKTCANKATIYFQYRISLSSISIVQVDTLIGMANFHIFFYFIFFIMFNIYIQLFGYDRPISLFPALAPQQICIIITFYPLYSFLV